MTHEVLVQDHQDVFHRAVQAAQRLGASALNMAFVGSVVSPEHFPGEARHFVPREFPGWNVATVAEVHVDAA